MATGIVMEYSMAEQVTPKKYLDNCLCCNADNNRVYCLNNNKARKQSALQSVEKLLELKLNDVSEKLFVCAPCLAFLDTLEKYRENIRQNISQVNARAKRIANTPENVLKKRTSVADQLQRSVEKIASERSIDTGKGRTGKRIRREILFGADSTDSSGRSDHAYCRDIRDEQNIPNAKIKTLLYGTTDSSVFIEVDKQLRLLASHGSVLFNKSALALSQHNLFNDAILEMHSGCPLLLNCLTTAIGDKVSDESKVATIATIYGMLLHSRNNKVSAVQRLYTSLALRYNADNELLTKLNQVHLTLTEDSRRNIIEGFGKESEDRIINEIAMGSNGKFNGDNLDIRVTTNDMRMNNHDKDYHFFATDFTFDRVETKDLNPKPPKGDNIPLESFLLTGDEETKLKNTLKVMLGRELLHLDQFQWMESIVPKHIQHPLQDEMSQKSKIFILPVSLNNEASYSDCVNIMEECEQYLNRWYSKAGRVSDLDDLHVPFGGDQLTRVRLQGAKALRLGAHLPSERFEHLHPVIIEMFHTLQDFLEKLCKKFLHMNLGRNVGTLPNLKVLIQRVNVNGNVKSRYKAHEDFVLTCGQGYFYSYILQKFQMNDLNDTPHHPAIHNTIKNWTNEHKLNVFNKVMDEVVADIFIPFKIQDEEMREITVKVTVSTQPPSTFEVPSHINEQHNINILLNIGGVPLEIKTTETDLVKGITFQLHKPSLTVKLAKVEKKDELNCYVLNFMQWYFVMLLMKDAVREGDINRINITLKHMIPFFYSHSPMSKYFTECIDYIMKTEHTLSPQLALKVRAATVVNPSGRKGKNKAADLQKENQVKYLKSLIRSLGSNKTEKSIVSITKAGPLIKEVCNNFDDMTHAKSIKKSHKVKSRDDDVKAIVNVLADLDIWTKHQNRTIDINVTRTPYQFDRNAFRQAVTANVKRLSRDLPIPVEDSDDEGDDDIIDDGEA